MLKYYTSFILVLGCVFATAQSKPIDTKPNDTIVREQKYGLRVGVDLSRIAGGFINNNYKGLEIVGDYRLSQNLYLAAELGNEEKTIEEDLYDFTTSGSYIKLGVDYNTYANWYGEQNSIFLGGRYAFSTYSQTLNNYTVYDSNRYWNPTDFAQGANQNIKYGGRNGSWLELLIGAKVEVFKNLYLGGSARLAFLLTGANRNTEFPDLFIPGFNKVTDGSRFGVGYNYTLTYFIPLYKKAKKVKKEVPSPTPENSEKPENRNKKERRN